MGWVWWPVSARTGPIILTVLPLPSFYRHRRLHLQISLSLYKYLSLSHLYITRSYKRLSLSNSDRSYSKSFPRISSSVEEGLYKNHRSFIFTPKRSDLWFIFVRIWPKMLSSESRISFCFFLLPAIFSRICALFCFVFLLIEIKALSRL